MPVVSAKEGSECRGCGIKRTLVQPKNGVQFWCIPCLSDAIAMAKLVRDYVERQHHEAEKQKRREARIAAKRASAKPPAEPES